MSFISLYHIFAQLLKLLGFWIPAKKHPQLGSAPTQKNNPGLAGGEIHQGHECLYRDRSDLIVCISLAGGPGKPGPEALVARWFSPTQPAWWSIMTGDSENLWQLASFRAWFNKDVSLFMTWIIHPTKQNLLLIQSIVWGCKVVP